MFTLVLQMRKVLSGSQKVSGLEGTCVDSRCVLITKTCTIDQTTMNIIHVVHVTLSFVDLMSMDHNGVNDLTRLG